MGSSETLRSVIDAGSAKRLDELSTARVIGKVAEHVHAAQQKAGAGKAIGPITPTAITIESTGAILLVLTNASALAYSAPEQLNATADRRSDVFSLGVVMWEALTHQRLFDGSDDAAIRLAIQSREVTPPSELNANIPAELGAICMKALARTASDRYQSAKVMAAEIEAVLEEAGYGDNDDKIAAYMAGLGQPATKPNKVTLPPLGMTVTPATGVPPPPIAVVPERRVEIPNDTVPNARVEPPNDTVPFARDSSARVPSILDKPPTQPPPMMTAASPGSLSPTKTIEPPAGAAVASTLAGATPPPKLPATILADPEPSASATIPGAGPPPPSSLPSAISTPTVHGFAAAAAFAAATTSAIEAPESEATAPTLPATFPPPPVPRPPATLPPPKSATTLPPPKLSSPTLPPVSLPSPLSSPPSSPMLPEVAKPPDPAPPRLPDAIRMKLPDLPPGATESAVAAVAAAAVTAVAESKSNTPHPASVVALPAPGAKAGRESQEVLGGWGWGTDSHAAIDQYEDPDDIGTADPTRKTLLYVLGGGLGLALVVTIIAVGFGGSSKKKKEPPPAAAMTEGSAAETTTPPPPPAAGSDTQAAAGSDTQAGPGSATGLDLQAGLGSATATSGSAVATSGSAVASGSGTTFTGSSAPVAAVVQPDVPKPDIPKPDVPKPDVPKPDVPKPDRVAVAQPPKAVAPKAVPPPRAVPPPKEKIVNPWATKSADPSKPKIADKRPEPPKEPARTSDPKVNADAAYKTGLQQFMRGDTAGALASLRTSLAGNPNHAPTWRGLGLVFEKMGEKDQARAAFKRYLQLAPSAGDADQIRNRLERLGS